MLKKILQKTIGPIVIFFIIVLVISVFRSVGLQKDDSTIKTNGVDVSVLMDDEQEDSVADEQSQESRNAGFEIVEDDSAIQTESIDAPASWDENQENSASDKADETNHSSSSENKGQDTNMPVENVPVDEDIEYGSIF